MELYELVRVVVISIVVCPVLCAVIYILYRILRNPFNYPYFTQTFDVTGKRNIEMEDYLDNFLRDEENWRLLQSHRQKIQAWKVNTEKSIQRSILRGYRARQYGNIIDDEHAYCFKTVRQQTRYQQHNYVKTSYKVTVTDDIFAVNWKWLVLRYKKLEEIGFEATLREYDSKNQRKLMTPALRKSIMERDNYTCQICGKYMPDEVGLHIDHIVPVVKGGKSVPSNLRVLCSKCNGSKGAK